MSQLPYLTGSESDLPSVERGDTWVAPVTPRDLPTHPAVDVSPLGFCAAPVDEDGSLCRIPGI